jgi:archaetidylinositol phosphate synthase
MLSRIQYLVEGLFQSTASVFFKIGLSPNGVTVLGFLLTLTASAFYAQGLTTGTMWAGCVVASIFGGYFDALDGAMARKYARTSRIGGIFDSVFDRLGEVAIFVGLAIGGLVSPLLALWAVSAALMVSYVRARVSAEGVTLKGVGIAERPERLLIMLIATLATPFNRTILYWAVLLVAVLSSLTVVERLYRTAKSFPKEESVRSQRRLSSRDRTLETPK